jgi:glyoxylase-like metal-dependent hydrolase (beta-lactamase superfamily II)
VRVDTVPGLYLRMLALGPMKNFVTLVGPASSPETAVVDPAWDVDAVLAAAREDGRTLTHALVTHRHADHTNGLSGLLARADVEVVVHEADAHALPDEVPAHRLRRTSDGDAVRLGDLMVTGVHTPGHTSGSQCFTVHSAPPVVIAGDTLFVGACGRCDLPGGDVRAMYRSLHRVLGGLPDETVLIPGHDYGDRPVSTLGHERRTNPYLLAADEEAFVAHRMRPREVRP